VAIAERAVEKAKNARWAAQTQRDALCGQLDRGVSQATCDNAQAQVQVSEEAVRIAQLQLDQLETGVRAEDLAALRAQLDQANSAVAGAQGGVDSAQGGVQAAQAALAQTESAIQAATAARRIAQAQVDVARASLDLTRSGPRSEQVVALQAQREQAAASVAAAEAALQEIGVLLGHTVLTSPVEGLVLERLAEPGELAMAGTPLLILGSLDPVTLTVYVPEAQLGQVALGQAVDVSVDAYSRSFDGTVSHIASEAEFTPRNVQTQEERVHMVFAVKVRLPNADLALKPGMPADATFQ
jgi:multidrug resistance efflux pump